MTYVFPVCCLYVTYMLPVRRQALTANAVAVGLIRNQPLPSTRQMFHFLLPVTLLETYSGYLSFSLRPASHRLGSLPSYESSLVHLIVLNNCLCSENDI